MGISRYQVEKVKELNRRYNDLLDKVHEFPTDDPSPNMQQCLMPINDKNYTRAVLLAEKHNMSRDIVAGLQELSFLQFIYIYQNYDGGGGSC